MEYPSRLGVVVFYVSEACGLEVDVVLEPFDVFLELGLAFLEFLALELEGGEGVGGVVDCLHHSGAEVLARFLHLAFRALEGKEVVVCSDVFGESLLHEVDEVGRLSAVGAVEGATAVSTSK